MKNEGRDRGSSNNVLLSIFAVGKERNIGFTMSGRRERGKGCCKVVGKQFSEKRKVIACEAKDLLFLEDLKGSF